MTVTVHDDFAEFWALAEPLYAVDPVLNNVALIAADSRVESNADHELLATVQRNGKISSATMAVGRRSALLTALDPADTAELVDGLVEHGITLTNCFGPSAVAAEFAELWSARMHCSITDDFGQLLYELGELHAPSGVPGNPRLATEDDWPAIPPMVEGFTSELGLSHDDAQWTESAMNAIKEGGLMLWETDGEIVAQALARQPSHQVSRISFVYTHKEHRGHGYAAAVTSATSELARNLGARHVVLHTDKGNLTSNGVYQRIGYQQVAEMNEYAF